MEIYLIHLHQNFVEMYPTVIITAQRILIRQAILGNNIIPETAFQQLKCNKSNHNMENSTIIGGEASTE